MRKDLILWGLVLLMLPLVATAEEWTVMHPDHETLWKWVKAYEAAPRAPIRPEVSAPEGSFTLIGHLKYTPSERNQGSCGNCWAWAGTGCLEVALDVQAGIYDRLSVQYITSCQEEVIGKPCCEGGWLSEVAQFYQITKTCIPWSNENARWQDGDASCDTACNTIVTVPNYPIRRITAQTIATTGVGQEAAITNIKNVLAQNRAVWYVFYLPDSAS